MNRAKLLLISLLAVIPLLGFATAANAQSFRSGDNITVPANTTLDSTLFASGRNINIAGNVEGDVFCAGMNITVSGRVSGDVMCAGQSVQVTGEVDGDVRVAGQNVTFGGTTTRNLSVAAQSFNSSGSSRVGGDTSIASQDVSLNGQFGRDLAAAVASLTINGQVGRNVTAGTEQLTLGENANINGNVEYTSRNKLQRDSSAVVSGTVTQKEPQEAQKADGGEVLSLFMVYAFFALLLFALALVVFMPRVFQAASDTALGNLLRTFLVGLLATIIVPLIIFTLLVTVVGIPIALLILLLWLAVLFLSGPFAAYLAGRLILRDNATNAILTMLLGAVVLLVLYFVPVLGFFVMLLALWFGVGMILQQVHIAKPEYNLVPTTATPAVKSATTAPTTRRKK